jgi:hypothetical protein
MGLVYISSVTASASATVSFTTGIDATYNEYQFHMVNMHPATDQVHFQFQVNAAGASGFNEVMTTTTFHSFHNEADTSTDLAYQTPTDQAQGTAYQPIGSFSTGNDNDQSVSGILTLYDPSSTTYVKHFTATGNGVYFEDYSVNLNTAGYINTTSAIDEISFNFASGNIDAGTIHMYGVG